MTLPIASNLGFPRIGPHRELKRALEDYWAGHSSADTLRATAASLRKGTWRRQAGLGITHIPSNDFSLYDHVLDTTVMLGAIPARFADHQALDPLQLYFGMARGLTADGTSIPAMDMTKWFDTNYHYIVPELHRDQDFHLASHKPLDEFREARALGIHTRPVLLGPVSYLMLSRMRDGAPPLNLLDRLLPVYTELLAALHAEGADWVQVDEPCLALDLSSIQVHAYQHAYDRLGSAGPHVLLATYFGGLGDNLPAALGLPVAALHLDLVRDPSQLAPALRQAPAHLSLSLGVIDGRGIWRAELDAALAPVRQAVHALGAERVLVAPSCSLLHVPVDLANEPALDAELHAWLAFATQKLEEVAALTAALGTDAEVPQAEFEVARAAHDARRRSPRTHNPAVRARAQGVSDAMRTRAPYEARRQLQGTRLGLPVLPTTTIGSFPQTPELRRARADARAGRMPAVRYEQFIQDLVRDAVQFQESAGLDVLVHGEFERNDMVEYFGEQLTGFAFTQNGWVQSYGSRCVKPPIIYGDVSRPRPMTVKWSQYAQSLTSCPVKGMLTGPVTMLQWSFVRDDISRADTCRQLALVVRDETMDLERAGIGVIQIDEPALREGLPLRHADWPAYLHWAVDAFRLASSGVRDDTQIHTHMCYSAFDDIAEAIQALDADVLSIETSRSNMEPLRTLDRIAYRNGVGPGVYDVHSPVIPAVQTMEALLHRALETLRPEQLWVNPDCGLKTRTWDEVRPALRAMVEAAHRARTTVDGGRQVSR